MSGAAQAEPVKTAVPIADLSALDAALEVGGEALKEALRKTRPADIGRDLSRRSLSDGRKLIDASDDRRASAILRSAHPTVAGKLLAQCADAHIARALAFLPTDYQVALLAGLDEDDRAKVEAVIDPGDRAEIQRILQYDESAAARLMTSKVWRMPSSGNAGEAMSLLRDTCNDIEVAQNCYVVDEAGKLVGVLALREVAIADPSARIDAIMTRDPIAISEDTDRGGAAEIVQTHNFLSLPIVDKEGRLVGAVRVDDLLQAALSRGGAEFLNQAGVSGKDAAAVPYFLTPIHRVVRSRITWLVLLFVAETATGTVLRHFEDELAKVVALSFFIPLLIGTGGNAGSQTVSTIIRALALGEVRLKDYWRVLAKEVTSGLLLGVLLGGIAFGRALLWGVSYDLAACVGVTVLVVCTWANTVGSMIPLAAQRVGIDPTVISGPLITTLVDASGLFLYLTIAKIMITALH
jgi:magnesium transporter